MLKLGDRTISALRLGGQKIKKAYLGDVLVASFEEQKPSRLPDGYTELEYIQTNGYCYIGTEYKLTKTFKLTMDVWPDGVDGNNGSFFWSYFRVSSSLQYYADCYMTTAKKVLAKFGAYGPTGTARTVVENLDLKRMVVSWDSISKTVSVDGTTSTWSSFEVHASMPSLRLLGANVASNYLVGKLYSCRIEDSGAVARDFVPCIDPSGTVGVYDLVGGKFYGNSGSGFFAAGPVV